MMDKFDNPTDKLKEPTNGKLTTLDEAKAVLEQESQARAQQFNDGLVKLAQETGYAVAPAVTLPGGEVVGLASFLKAMNINAQPAIQIVPK